MAKKTKTGQKRHDEAVLRSAEWYENQGYNIKADLPEWERPKTIGGHRPDFIAKKGKKEIIVEIETENTNTKDKPQHEAFQKYTERKQGRGFRKKVV